MKYRADIEQNRYKLFTAETDKDALKQYWKIEEEGHKMYGLYQVNRNNKIIRTI